MTVSHIVFIILSAVVLGGALAMVITKSMFRAALFMALSFVGIAGLFVLLEAELLGMLQLLVYVGAIAILIIFAIMLSRRIMSGDEPAFNKQWTLGLVVVALPLFILLALVLLQVNWPVNWVEQPPADAVARLGEALVSPEGFVLPFEVASVLLVVALVGAIVIAREE
jgi:NADH:ubiquinone oxidoreductase subunit 6 (subunit J)